MSTASAESLPAGLHVHSAGRVLAVRRIRQVLSHSPHSRELPCGLLDLLAECGRIERCKSGQLLHAAWRPMRQLWLVLSGGLRVAQVGEDGRALTIAVLGEGSWYGAGSLLKAGSVEKTEAHAVGSTQLAVFEPARLEEFCAGDPVMQQHKSELLYRRNLALIDFYRDVLSVPLPQSLARRLLSQALAAGRGPEIELFVAQADLAAMLGASRSRVNAELRRLEAGGAVRRGYRRLVVCDLALLRAAAGADVTPL